nr:hypothetical protein CFP56_79048 [Quercus suber]
MFLSPLQAHRKHTEFLNKRIEMYDELALVVDKDMATENDDDTENVANNGEEGVVDKGDKGKNVVESSTIGSTTSKSHKRGRAPPGNDSVFTDLSDQLKEIAVALKEINWGSVDYTNLYSEVMAMVSDLTTAFDHLCENKKATRGFLVENTKLRKLGWIFFLFTQL